MKRLRTIIYSTIFFMTGCSLDIPYENQFSDPTAISTPETARELLASAYAALPTPEYDLSIMSDDFAPAYWATSNPSLINQYNWQPQSIETLSVSIWGGYYEVIATLNALTERAEKIADSDAIRRIRGEALTLKAYCYYQLLQFYGQGPDNPDADAIVLKDKLVMANLKRSSVREVLAEIESLLRSALPLLATGGENSDWLGPDAARTLLAKVLLYAGRYGEAATEALTVVNSRGYASFAPDVYRDLWDGTRCDERIFALNNPTITQSYYLGIVYDIAGGDYFTVNPVIAKSYSETDIRGNASVLTTTYPTLGPQDCFGKYNACRKNQREINIINKIRLSDALFTYAEACALDNNDKDARTAINLYLDKRDAEDIDETVAGKALLSRIIIEKQKEFIGEGQRFFDLKFYRNKGITDFRVKADDYRWNFPIPREEYLYNDNMTQNDKWTITHFN